jgi:hypothetical protein
MDADLQGGTDETLNGAKSFVTAKNHSSFQERHRPESLNPAGGSEELFRIRVRLSAHVQGHGAAAAALAEGAKTHYDAGGHLRHSQALSPDSGRHVTAGRRWFIRRQGISPR